MKWWSKTSSSNRDIQSKSKEWEGGFCSASILSETYTSIVVDCSLMIASCHSSPALSSASSTYGGFNTGIKVDNNKHRKSRRVLPNHANSPFTPLEECRQLDPSFKDNIMVPLWLFFRGPTECWCGVAPLLSWSVLRLVTNRTPPKIDILHQKG